MKKKCRACGQSLRLMMQSTMVNGSMEQGESFWFHNNLKACPKQKKKK